MNPCPWCGSQPVRYGYKYEHPIYYKAFIRCGNFYCSRSPVVCGKSMFRKRAERKAEEAWNAIVKEKKHRFPLPADFKQGR